jgi:hypothetical protein
MGVVKRALAGALIAAIGNAIVYVIAYVTGIIPWNMLSPGRSVSITPRLVILVSIGGALGGALLYEITKRLSSDPVQKFRLAAFLILIASFSAPLAIDTFTRALTIVLDVMHVVVYAATVWALTVWSPREPLRASA